jgi:hypothetical protein
MVEIGGRVGAHARGIITETSYASSLPSLRMAMYFSHKSPVT